MVPDEAGHLQSNLTWPCFCQSSLWLQTGSGDMLRCRLGARVDRQRVGRRSAGLVHNASSAWEWTPCSTANILEPCLHMRRDLLVILGRCICNFHNSLPTSREVPVIGYNWVFGPSPRSAWIETINQSYSLFENHCKHDSFFHTAETISGSYQTEVT